MEFIKKNRFGLIIVILYLVGIIGFLVPAINQEWAYLTAISLIISTIILVLKHHPANQQFYFSMILVGLIGYLVEIIGVKTGVLFGSYEYGRKLGPKLFEVPLMIGVNWALLVYLTHYLAKRFSSKAFQIAAIGASLLVAIDFFIEPFAIYFGLWTWSTVEVPLRNYFMWWITGFFLHLLFRIYNPKIENSISNFILMVLVLFFMIIDLFVIWF